MSHKPWRFVTIFYVDLSPKTYLLQIIMELLCDQKNLKWMFISYFHTIFYDNPCKLYIPCQVIYTNSQLVSKTWYKMKFITEPIFYVIPNIFWHKEISIHVKSPDFQEKSRIFCAPSFPMYRLPVQETKSPDFQQSCHPLKFHGLTCSFTF